MEVASRFLASFLMWMAWIIVPLCDMFRKKISQRIPKTDNPILHMSASALAKKIREKELTSVQVVTIFINRVKEVNPIINAMVQDRFEEAMQEAAECDSYLTGKSIEFLESTKPLLGVPITIKENLAMKGCSITVGSLARKNEKSEEDATCVQRVKAAGAVPILVSNTPEYCLSMETYNFVTGRTNNPYNTLCNPGGSSGGEGAILGSGASVIGLGSDIAGSIRIPSCFNGIFGHKISPYLSPLKGHFPESADKIFNYHLTVGPMVRYCEDLILMTKILTGDDAKLLKLDEKVDLSKLNVFFMDKCGSDFGMVPVQREIKEAINRCAVYLSENCKANIKTEKFDFNEAVEMGFSMHFSIKDTPNSLQVAKANPNLELLKCMFGKSQFPLNIIMYAGLEEVNGLIRKSKVEEYKKQLEELEKHVHKSLGDDGILLFPSFPTSAIPHNGHIYASIGTTYLLIINALGLPSTNVPVGFDNKNMPIGIQVVAGPKQDRLCFAVAKELEKLYGGWKPPY